MSKNYDVPGQLSMFDLLAPDIWSGRTFQEPLVAEPQRARTFKQCLKKPQKLSIKLPLFLDLRTGNGHQPDASWQTDGVSLGEFMMHSGGGVAQRRKRICMLCDFNGQTAGEILFELQRKTDGAGNHEVDEHFGAESEPEVHAFAESLPGNPESSGKAGQGAARSIAESIGDASYTLKIRGGKDVDRYGRRAGKGALVQTELSGTLGVSQDQTLVTVEQQKQIEDFVNGVNAEAKHQQDLIQSDLGVARTLAPGTHASGSHLTKTLVTRGINAEDDQKAVVYGISSDGSNAMKSDNPKSGIYEAETSRTLDLNGGSPACNQGGMAVVQGVDIYNGTVTGDVAASITANGTSHAGGTGPKVLVQKDDKAEVVAGLREIADFLDSDDKAIVHRAIELICCIEGNGARESHREKGYVESETMFTLNTVEQHAVAYCKTSHAKTAEDGQGWQETEVNAFDNGESQMPTLVLENHLADSRVKIAEDGVAQTLSSRMGTGGGNVPMVMSDVAATRSAADGEKDVHSQMLSNPEENFVVGPVAVASKASYMTNAITDGNANTLVATDWKDPQVVAYGLDRASYNQGQNAKFGFSIEEEKIGAETSQGPRAVCTSVVRRLTPLECERLQGFPDDWTNIGDWTDTKGKLHKGDSDSPRYKALGNSIALPFWRWLAKRMAAVLRLEGYKNLSMASLFDGIGGFPLVFSEVGIKPVWASEIEEFPIAVTKIRFPEEGE